MKSFRNPAVCLPQDDSFVSNDHRVYVQLRRVDLLFDVELDLLTRSQDPSYILRDRAQRRMPSVRFETRDVGVPVPLQNKRENIAKPNSTNAVKAAIRLSLVGQYKVSGNYHP